MIKLIEFFTAHDFIALCLASLCSGCFWWLLFKVTDTYLKVSKPVRVLVYIVDFLFLIAAGFLAYFACCGSVFWFIAILAWPLILLIIGLFVVGGTAVKRDRGW